LYIQNNIFYTQTQNTSNKIQYNRFGE